MLTVQGRARGEGNVGHTPDSVCVSFTVAWAWGLNRRGIMSHTRLLYGHNVPVFVCRSYYHRLRRPIKAARLGGNKTLLEATTWTLAPYMCRVVSRQPSVVPLHAPRQSR
ncbi:unnamed protein product, partial [Ectocarpus sp. 4 AP-2014]